MSFDLNINNYELQDLFNLFNISNNFDIDDLKNVKKIVLKTHPDKSGLSKEYFLFYTKAYRILLNIYEFKQKKSLLKEGSIKYSYENLKNIINYDTNNESNNRILDKIIKQKGDKFNDWFNKEFEKLMIKDNDNGYEDWFRHENESDINNKNITMSNLESHKKNLSDIIIKNEIEDLQNNSFGSILLNKEDLNYNSNIFSNLNYKDLKEAHTESVIPVCNRDFEIKQKFNNINSLKTYRDSQNITPLTKKEANDFFNIKNNNEENLGNKRGYELYLQEEKSKINNNKFWSNLKLLS